MSPHKKLFTTGAIAIVSVAAIGIAVASRTGAEAGNETVPLKEAKLIIEHNATDHDTGFQAAVDSEGWQNLELSGPGGKVLSFQARGKLGKLGLTELFFETVEPANDDVPIQDILKTLPEGRYTFSGKAMESGESAGRVQAVASLSHKIPDGPKLLTPAAGASVPAGDLLVSWEPVSKTINGEPIKIIAYQLIIEKDGAPHPTMIGKFGLSMYLPATTTSITIGKGFLEPGTKYLWEVLAIAESGNQTLSSSEFSTR